MRILILDDQQERHDAFATMYPQHDRVHALGYDAAIAALDAGLFDCVFLDHDLGDYKAGVERTGMDVVNHIGSLPEEKRPPRAVVHSHNESRAREMVLRLREAGVRAFWEMYRAPRKDI